MMWRRKIKKSLQIEIIRIFSHLYGRRKAIINQRILKYLHCPGECTKFSLSFLCSLILSDAHSLFLPFNVPQRNEIKKNAYIISTN